MPSEVTAGDLHNALNTSNLDSLTTEFHWQLTHIESSEHVDEHTGYHWDIDTKDLEYATPLEVQLSAKTVGDDSIYIDKKSFLILCEDQPQLDRISSPNSGLAGQEVVFIADILNQNSNFHYSWKFGTETNTLEGKDLNEVSHTFETDGNYTVELTINDPTQTGVCSITRSKDISIGQQKVFLNTTPLIKDQVSAYAGFEWIRTGLLLGFLALQAFAYWLRWFRRKPPTNEEEDKLASGARAHSGDRAPYFIPFGNKNNLILPDRERNELARIFRLRNQGYNKYIDIQSSVRATIEKGGFTNLRYTHKTTPTDYLFLIEEQYKFSHQKSLFTFLVQFMGNEEVVADVFYYDTDFHRFWNDQLPQGTNLEGLQNQFPNNRLVIMGDGHGLINPFAREQVELKPDTLQILKKWQIRVLLSPIAPTSWIWKEKLLFDNFLIFPADANGLGDAAAFLSARSVEEDLPSRFVEWKSDFEKIRKESDLNYYDWEDWSDHIKYLSDRPDMQTWLHALAIWPNPVWEITVAIGKALEPYGVKVSYDNLLVLARIPWLQNGQFDPELRFEMLDSLHTGVETKARMAIKTELERIKDSIAGSHAFGELETGLCMQQFSLDPNDKAAQNGLTTLLNNNALNRAQIHELDQTLEKYYEPNKNQRDKVHSKDQKTAPSVQQFLKEQQEEVEPPKTPFWNSDLIKACILSVVLLILSTLAWRLEGTETLYKMAFGAVPQQVSDSKLLKTKYFIVQEKMYVDSAIIYNNAGVDLSTGRTPSEFSAFGELYPINLFKRALGIQPDYALANENMAKQHLNSATTLYNESIADSSNAYLTLALSGFHSAANTEITHADALHGLGLCHYYYENIDSAQFYYQTLKTYTSNTYFDTVAVFPHLESLLLFNDTLSADTNSVDINNQIFQDTITYVLNNLNNTTFDASTNGGYDFDYWPDGGIWNVYHHINSMFSYEDLQKLMPVDIFLSGPHSKTRMNLDSRNSFGHYNPEAVAWMNQQVDVFLNSNLKVRLTRPLVDKYLKNNLMGYWLCYKYLNISPEEKQTAKQYYKGLIDSRSMPDFFYIESLVSMESRITEFYYLDVNTVVPPLYYWIRRSMDGTEDDLFKILDKIVRAYFPNEVTAAIAQDSSLGSDSAANGDEAFQNKMETVLNGLGNTYFNPPSDDDDSFDYWPDGGLWTVYHHINSLFSYEELQKMMPHDLFLSGPHSKTRLSLRNANSFGHYNPKAVEWIDQQADAFLSSNTKVVLAKQLMAENVKDVLLTYWLSYQYLNLHPNEKRIFISKYLTAINQGPLPNFFHYSIPQTIEDKILAFEYAGINTVGTPLYYWARRSTDGTEANLFNIIDKTVRALFPNEVAAAIRTDRNLGTSRAKRRVAPVDVIAPVKCQILDQSTRKPVANATVSIKENADDVWIPHDLISLTLTTNEEGFFEFDIVSFALKSGINIEISAEGYRPHYHIYDRSVSDFVIELEP